MGLDQYLYRRRYVQNWDHLKPEDQTEVTFKRGGKEIPLTNPAFIIEQVGYWRKANQIHHWFVENVQGGKDECQEANVDIEQLEELYDIVVQVLHDHSKAPLLLPPRPGFFFGSYDYDEWYFSGLEETKKILAPIIERESQPHSWMDSGDYYYQSSW